MEGDCHLELHELLMQAVDKARGVDLKDFCAPKRGCRGAFNLELLMQALDKAGAGSLRPNRGSRGDAHLQLLMQAVDKVGGQHGKYVAGCSQGGAAFEAVLHRDGLAHGVRLDGDHILP